MRRTMTDHLPPHPIEATEAFKVYVSRPGLRGADSLQRSLIRFFREMAPCKLDGITVIHINNAVERLSAKGYNPSYIDKMFRYASAFYSWCRELGYVDSNPFKSTSAPEVKGVFVPTVVPKEDIERIHDHIMKRGIVEEIILWGALRMGARISEPCMATIGDALPGSRTVDEFLVDPKVVFATKTSARFARQPRFTLPAYRKLLEAKGDQKDSPLLYLKGVPLLDKHGNPNIEARVLVARTWFAAMQKEALGDYRWTPKTLRSTFISREIVSDPSKAMAVAMQCGNSVKVIQSNYLQYFQMPEFASGEA